MYTRRITRRAIAAAGLFAAGSAAPMAPDLSAQNPPVVTSETIDR